VVAGKLPIIPAQDAVMLLADLNSLDYSGTMTMSAEADVRIEAFWSEQPPEVQKKVRWKKHLMLDTYMSTFGEGRKEVNLGDVEMPSRFSRAKSRSAKHTLRKRCPTAWATISLKRLQAKNRFVDVHLYQPWMSERTHRKLL